MNLAKSILMFDFQIVSPSPLHRWHRMEIWNLHIKISNIEKHNVNFLHNWYFPIILLSLRSGQFCTHIHSSVRLKFFSFISIPFHTWSVLFYYQLDENQMKIERGAPARRCRWWQGGTWCRRCRTGSEVPTTTFLSQNIRGTCRRGGGTLRAG